MIEAMWIATQIMLVVAGIGGVLMGVLYYIGWLVDGASSLWLKWSVSLSVLWVIITTIAFFALKQAPA